MIGHNSFDFSLSPNLKIFNAIYQGPQLPGGVGDLDGDGVPDGEDQDPNNDEIQDMSDYLANFTKHSNKSLYPGLGSSDLYKPSARATIKGEGNCAKKCFDDANCVAFHHWKKHPENQHKDYCYYWSKNNSANEYGELKEALGAGDEGKGSDYQADAYIKKQPVEDDDTNGGGGLGDGGPAPPPQDETQDYTPLLIGGGVILLIALLS
jgi:hypothetical protein